MESVLGNTLKCCTTDAAGDEPPGDRVESIRPSESSLAAVHEEARAGSGAQADKVEQPGASGGYAPPPAPAPSPRSMDGLRKFCDEVRVSRYTERCFGSLVLVAWAAWFASFPLPAHPPPCPPFPHAPALSSVVVSSRVRMGGVRMRVPVGCGVSAR